jgi:hypothetical protein
LTHVVYSWRIFGASAKNRAIRSNKKPNSREWSLGQSPKLRKQKTVRFFVPLLSLALLATEFSVVV